MSAENTQEKKRWGQDKSATSDFEDDGPDEETGLTAGKGRATPSQRERGKKEEETGNFVVRFFRGLVEYFGGVKAELQKVAWPTRQDARRLTILVLAITILASLALGLVSLGFTELFRIGLQQPPIFIGFFVIVVVVGFVLYRRSNNDSAPY
jgi:preprotein translocase SecE subunit